MDDKFNQQKDTLIAIKKEINLLHQQVDYLIRNNKPLELLDLDVMMNRTHTIYDLMCGVEVGSETLESGEGDEELPVGLDTIKEMFGITEKEEPEEVYEDEEDEDWEVKDKPDSLEEQEPENEENVEENEDAYFIEELEDVADSAPENETTPEEVPMEVPEDRGFILNFEPMDHYEEKPLEEPAEEPAEEPVEEPEKEEPGKEEESVRETEMASVYTTGDEIEMTIPHLEFPEQDITDEIPEESPTELPFEADVIENTIETTETTGETVEEHIEQTIEDSNEESAEEMIEEPVEEEIAYEPVVIGNMEEKDDGGFELEAPATLGERLQMEQNPTLADKLQHSTVNSLQSAIGINDKFLFVNELFNGSMEKYNRSIANLDDLKTLNGALIYLNELRIELQWNSSNEAYRKLLELVHLKFGA